MNEIVINNKPLPVREYKGNRVVTFKDIDEVHGRKDERTERRESVLMTTKSGLLRVLTSLK